MLGYAGCSNDAPGGDGTAGAASDVVVRTEAASPQDCGAGGTVVLSGLDADRDGTLEDSEVQQRTTVCNEPSPTPPPVLVRVAGEPAGERCPDGGSVVLSGPDLNGNGVLDDSEVVASDVVCRESLLTRMESEPPGEHCPGGGILFFVGRDTDGDGTLSDTEVEWTTYECSNVISLDVTLHTPEDVALVASIEAITGSLTVEGSSITDLALPALVHVGRFVDIGNNAQLERVSMPVLADVGGYLWVRDDPSLTTLDLGALVSVLDEVQLSNDAALADGSGLSPRLYVGGRFIVASNASLSALVTPASVRGDVSVVDNPLLAALDLSFADGSEDVTVRNDGITDLHVSSTALSGASRLGSIWVLDNPSLRDVWIHADDVGGVTVRGNPSLEEARVSSTTVHGDVVVAGGPAMTTASIYADSGSYGHGIEGSVHVSGGADGAFIDFDSCDGALVENTLATLVSIPAVRGNLYVENASKLHTLTVNDVGGDLAVVNDDALVDLFFGQDTEVLGDIIIDDNALLDSLYTLEGREALHGSLVVTNNPSLLRTDITTTTSIAGDLRIANNPELGDLGLNALRSVGGSVYVSANGMTSWNGLASLEEVGGGLAIGGGGQLTDVSLPALRSVAHWVQVHDNADLLALDLPTLQVGESMDVWDNPKLPACAVDALFAGLPGWQTQQSGNDTTAVCP